MRIGKIVRDISLRERKEETFGVVGEVEVLYNIIDQLSFLIL